MSSAGNAGISRLFFARRRLDNRTMTKFQENLFELWKRVKNGDRTAKKEFEDLYLERYPRNQNVVEGSKGNYAKSYLHIMYSHLYKLRK